ARVEPRERVVPEAEALHRARTEVLDDDDGRLHYLLEHLPAPPRLEVEGHRLLVGVQEAEEDRVHARLLADPASRRLAPRRLDLDDLGTQPRERFCAARPRLVLRKVEHPDSGQSRAPPRAPCVAADRGARIRSWPRARRVPARGTGL